MKYAQYTGETVEPKSDRMEVEKFNNVTEL